MKRTTALIVVALLAVLLLNLTGCSGSAKRAPYQPATVTPSEPILKPEPSPPSASSVELPKLRGSLAILSHTMAKEGGPLVVRGVAKNVGVSTLTYAEIVVQFKDAKGEIIEDVCTGCGGAGTTIWRDQRITTLQPGETWDFKVVFLPFLYELVNSINSYDIEVGVLR